MEKVRQSNTLEHHKTDLKEAIFYLPPEFDKETLYKSLKTIYGDEVGKDLVREWFLKGHILLPVNFNTEWEKAKLTAYQQHDLESYLNTELYSIAREVGWTPKSFRKGKNSKKPPIKSKLKAVGKELESAKVLEKNLTQARERRMDKEKRSYIPPHITNKDGACYFHPYMKKSNVPEDEEEYLSELTKIVDCEVIVEEAIEIILDQPGQNIEDKEVKYQLRLTNRKGKDVQSTATFWLFRSYSATCFGPYSATFHKRY